MKACATSCAIASVLLLLTTTALAGSGHIESVDPSVLHFGREDVVTVRIANDSDSPKTFLLYGNVPEGCSLKPIQAETSWLGKRRGYWKLAVSPKGSSEAKFQPQFSGANMSGTIAWTLKEDDGYLSQTELGNVQRQIIPKVSVSQWRDDFEKKLSPNLRTGAGGFKELIETIHRPGIDYKSGCVKNVAIKTADGKPDAWADGYNISEIIVTMSFGWSRSLSAPYLPSVKVSDGHTDFEIIYTRNPVNGDFERTNENLISSDAALPTMEWKSAGEWGKVGLGVAAAIITVIKAYGAAVAATAAAAGS